MKLQHLTDKVLHEEALRLVTFERTSLVRLLYHLMEIDRRKLYSDHECSSLFDYCVRILGQSESSAQRRIVAARMLAKIPDLGNKIETGALTLTNVSLVNRYFKEEKDLKKVLEKMENLTKKECEKKIFEISGKVEDANEERKRISGHECKVTMILSDEAVEEMEKLKSLLGKNLNSDELIKFMAKAAIEKVEKKKFKLTEKPKSALPPAEVARTPAAALKREVYLRDKKCVICGGVHQLNYDHRTPYALGGRTSAENLRLLCFNCNQRSRIKVFGHRSTD